MALFNPSREEVRRFFCETWQKQTQSQILTPLETLAAKWIEQHPEYHPLLINTEEAIQQDYTPEGGVTNPFLHLSMHLSISEQISIDQPPGIRLIQQRLAQKLGSEHEAQHQIMECLGQVMWEAQRLGKNPDTQAYSLALQRLL
ncbi:Protein of unknown function DUF1841 [Burkholderiaceae bacterium]